MLEMSKFESIRRFLDDFVDDPEVKSLCEKYDFTEGQLKIVNVLIVHALQTYDALKSGAEPVSG